MRSHEQVGLHRKACLSNQSLQRSVLVFHVELFHSGLNEQLGKLVGEKLDDFLFTGALLTWLVLNAVLEFDLEALEVHVRRHV